MGPAMPPTPSGRWMPGRPCSRPPRRTTAYATCPWSPAVSATSSTTAPSPPMTRSPTSRPRRSRSRPMTCVVAGRRTAAQLHPVAGQELDASVRERGHAQLGSRQVDQHADRAALVVGHASDAVDEGELGRRLAVREVDADDVGTRRDHLAQHRLVPRGRPDGRHDLGTPHCLSFRALCGRACPRSEGRPATQRFRPPARYRRHIPIGQGLSTHGGRRSPRAGFFFLLGT